MRNVHGDFIWYELMTPKPDAAAAFYGAVMGWGSHAFAGDTTGYRAFSANGTDVAGLLRTPAEAEAGGARPSWFGYVGVDDVDKAAADIVAGGGTQYVPPTDIPGVGRFAMLTDPQGAAFYVMRGEPDETSKAFDPASAGHCQWNELSTSDPAAALSFYTSRFGWTKGDTMPMGEMGDYQFIDHHGGMIGALTKATNGMPSAWLYYFGVEDIDKAAQAVTENGGEIHFGPDQVPTGGYIIIASDPEGAMFGAVGPRQE